MLKITRKARTADWNGRGSISGSAVQVEAFPALADDPNGSIQISFGRRLTPEVMGDCRETPQFATTFRQKRLLVTSVNLSPEAAIMLHNALDTVLKKAKIVQALEKKSV